MKIKKIGSIAFALAALIVLCVGFAPRPSAVLPSDVAIADTSATSSWTPVYNGNYYDNVNSSKTGNALREELYDRISRPHNNTSYAGLANAYKTADADPDKNGNILWFYTGTSVSFNGNFGSNPGTTNREHVWPKNGGDAFPEKSGPGSDAHHLRACEAQLNSTRGSKSFNEVPQTSGNVVKQDGDTGYGNLCYSDGSFFYPGKGYRGATARILFYVQTRWGDQYNLSFVDSAGRNKTIGKISTLLKWHLEEPPTEEEVRRNEAVFKLQGNRNPFIDHPEYAALIYCNDGQSYNNALRSVVAQYGNYNDEIPEIESLSITPSTLETLKAGQSVTLDVIVSPSGANKDVTWSTSDSSVATVNAQGKVTAVAQGYATITAVSKENSNVKATVSVRVKEATGISLQGSPTKKVYDAGDVFDPQGITVKLLYSDGTQETVANNACQWLDGSTNTTQLSKGSTSVKCRYGDFVAEVSNIVVRYVTGISVDGTAEVTSYAAGQSFDPTGLTVDLVYNNGDRKRINNSDCTWLDNNGQVKLSNSSTSIICKYGDITADVDVEIFIKFALKIEVSGALLKTEYVLGSKFDPTGLSVTIFFNDGSTGNANVNDCRWVDEQGNEVLAKNAQNVTCIFGENQYALEQEILVKELVGIKVVGTPDKQQYGFGERFDPTGLTVTAQFDNGGSDEQIALSNCQWLDNNGKTQFDSSSTGVKCVYNGKEATVSGVQIVISANVQNFISAVEQIDENAPLEDRFNVLRSIVQTYSQLTGDEKLNSAVMEAYGKLTEAIRSYNSAVSEHNVAYDKAASVSAEAIAKTMMALLAIAFVVTRKFN